MTRSAVLTLVCICSTLVLGCGKKESMGVQPADRFPGYTQVTKEGEASQLYINQSEFPKVENGWTLRAVKTFTGGYAVFDLLTDCVTVYKRMDARHAEQRFQGKPVSLYGWSWCSLGYSFTNAHPF